MEHDLKSWPETYQATLDGRKTAEFRRDDRHYARGDTLLLREWEPQVGEYTGRVLSVTVTDVRRAPAWGIPDGYVLMSIREGLQAHIDKLAASIAAGETSFKAASSEIAQGWPGSLMDRARLSPEQEAALAQPTYYPGASDPRVREEQKEAD